VVEVEEDKKYVHNLVEKSHREQKLREVKHYEVES
jgi:hypothetical protein